MASGQGRLFNHIVLESRKNGINVAALVSDKPQSGAAEKAQKLNITHVTCSPGEDLGLWDKKLCDELQKLNPDLIVLAGFLRKLGPQTVKSFDGRIVNSHPALLPQFGGKGMYGRHVYEAVVAAKAKESGVTIHLVSEELDKGRIIKQAKFALIAHETVASLEEKTRKFEEALWAEFLKEFSQRRSL